MKPTDWTFVVKLADFLPTCHRHKADTSACYARYVISFFSASLTEIEKTEEEEMMTRQDTRGAGPRRAGPAAGSGTKLWSGQTRGTCWTSRGAVGRPRRRCRRSRTRANGLERSDPSKDEGRSSATVKRARHLSCTCSSRLAHLPLSPFGPYFSFLLLIRPVPHHSRILWFSPGNVYLRRDSATRR